ncbi:hypothetical protein QFC21_006949 [Naganishia friedmannii]|uniref:Uncharacterized protein n=1 Tax=Naganishia friedmannii TaxID=89922 RepID=A0ACC2UZD2_9TREE|nr:hypothetical protein QFC21_006949 [Naganishia friedmannii]
MSISPSSICSIASQWDLQDAQYLEIVDRFAKPTEVTIEDLASKTIVMVADLTPYCSHWSASAASKAQKEKETLIQGFVSRLLDYQESLLNQQEHSRRSASCDLCWQFQQLFTEVMGLLLKLATDEPSDLVTELGEIWGRAEKELELLPELPPKPLPTLKEITFDLYPKGMVPRRPKTHLPMPPRRLKMIDPKVSSEHSVVITTSVFDQLPTLATTDYQEVVPLPEFANVIEEIWVVM